jgi:hypothetical protein
MADRKAIVEAVNYIIVNDRYNQLIREITNIIERWDTHPMAYDGKLKVLNALIDVGLESREAFEKLVALIESRRAQLPDLKRVDYQRDLMRERRARIAKALELHELTQGPITTVKQKEKLTADYTKRWSAARKKFIAGKGKLEWKERNVASGEFWKALDTELDEGLKAARRRK